MGRAIGASRSLAVFATVDDASNEEAAAFYRDFGFISFPSRPLRPFILMLEAAKAAIRALSYQAFCALICHYLTLCVDKKVYSLYFTTG